MAADEDKSVSTVPDRRANGADSGEATKNGTAPASRALPWLCLAALGVVFGDISTSPLYALRECFSSALIHVPSHHDAVLGVLSLILWSLIVVISVKYLLWVLRADNRGEGGILALLSLLEIRGEARRRPWNRVLLFCGTFGAALLYGDGMITPAISVLSAVEGLEVATPAFEPWVVPITIAILVALFLFQQFGSGRVGMVFGPIVLLWLLTLGGLGLHGIAQAPQVLQAFNPVWALQFLFSGSPVGFVVLGAVFLVVTGGEALYADIGHFGKLPIRITWFIVVLPSLMLNYLGQGALMLARGGSVDHLFFELAPEWAVYPLVALATAATVIASQAIITGAFSLTRQAVRLDEFPRVQILQTSESERGQVYVPLINWLLMIATIGLVLVFRRSEALAGAYGVAISLTMVLTTVLIAFVALRRWRWNPWLVAAITAPLLVVDVGFFGSTLLKFVDGGWLPIVVAALFYLMMTTWARGRRLLARQESRASRRPGRFFATLDQMQPHRVQGVGIFVTASTRDVPAVVIHHVEHNQVLYDTVVLLTVITRPIPHVPLDQRVRTRTLNQGFIRIRLSFGFMDPPDVPHSLRHCPHLGFDASDATYYVTRRTVLPTDRVPGMQVWRERLFVRLLRNATLPTTEFRLPPDRVLEIGRRIEI